MTHLVNNILTLFTNKHFLAHANYRTENQEFYRENTNKPPKNTINQVDKSQEIVPLERKA